MLDNNQSKLTIPQRKVFVADSDSRNHIIKALSETYKV